MKTLFISYNGTQEDRFDQRYYADIHVPMARQALASLGLLSIDAFFPSGDSNGVVAVCMATFKDDESMKAALSSTAMTPLVEDLKTSRTLCPFSSEWFQRNR